MFKITLVNKAGNEVFSDSVFASCDLDAAMQVLEKAAKYGHDTKELKVLRTSK